MLVLAAEEGGRHKPFSSGYRPQFFFGTTDVTGTVFIDDATGSVAPGAQADVTIALQKSVGLEPGVRFAMREGGRTVGAGVVSEVLGSEVLDV